jgi:predicted HTH transcriptional regulator
MMTAEDQFVKYLEAPEGSRFEFKEAKQRFSFDELVKYCKGAYTRQKGLDRDTNKELLLKHIRENAKHGARLEELQQVLPSLSRNQVQTLVRELKKSNKIKNIGRTNAARWYPV